MHDTVIDVLLVRALAFSRTKEAEDPEVCAERWQLRLGTKTQRRINNGETARGQPADVVKQEES